MTQHPFADRWNHNSHYYPRIDALVPTGPVSVVDVGCGEGTLARHLARSGRHVLGIDPDAPVRQPAAGERSAVPLVAGVAEHLPCATGSVDAVTMVMVLHHAEPAAALAEVRRVLRPGGVAVILGYGRVGGLRDLPLELRDTVAHRWHSRRTTAWEPEVALAAPDRTWAEARQLLRTELPGGTYRRLPMWRYLYVWTAPGDHSAQA